MEQDQLINTDCLPILANMPDLSVDSVITDPPYPNGSGLFTEYLTDGIAALYLCAKKAKKHVIFFWTPVVEPPRPPPGWFHTATIIWDKPDCKTSIRYETIHVWSRDYKRQAYKILSVPIVSYQTLQDYKEHPTQKPVKLMRFLIEDYTKEGELILDPFAGTGTTGIAARQRNRHYLLIESNKEYAAIAQQRLAVKREPEATQQPTIDQPPEQPTRKSDAKQRRGPQQ